MNSTMLIISLLLPMLFLLPAAFGVHVNQHIVGGSEAFIGDHPWQGSFRDASGEHTCGLVLIGDVWAVSAAHCGGSSSYTTEWGNSERGQGPYPAVISVTLNPEYGQAPGAFPNDISVVSLASLTWGTPIAIAHQRINGGGTAQMSGWGSTCGGCSPPLMLQATEMSVLSDSECWDEWGTNYNADIHICMFEPVSRDKAACPGDSGGPMVVGGLLHGVSSWGLVNCGTTRPTVFTRVSIFYDWLCDQTLQQAKGCQNY